MSKTKIHYIDSENKEKIVMSDDLDGTLEVKPNMELVNTTSLDVVRIVAIQTIEE